MRRNLPADDAGAPGVVDPALAVTAACTRASTDAIMRGSELAMAAWTAWSSIAWKEEADTAAGADVGVGVGRPDWETVDVDPELGAVAVVVPVDVLGAPEDAIFSFFFCRSGGRDQEDC